MDDAPVFKLFTKDQPAARRSYKKRVTLNYSQQRQVEERLRELLTVLGDPADKLCKYASGFNDIRVADEMPFDCTASCVETVRRSQFGKTHVKQPEPSAPSNEVAVLRAEFATLRAVVAIQGDEIARQREEIVALQEEAALQHKEMATLYEETGSQRSDINALTVRLNRLASALGEPA